MISLPKKVKNVWKIKTNYLLSIIIYSGLFLKVLINWRDIKDTEKILWQNQNLVHSSFFHFASTAALKWEKVEETFEKWSPVLFVLFSVQRGVKYPLKQNWYPALFCSSSAFLWLATSLENMKLQALALAEI